ncbi:MAG: LapA family protein [Gelidibacter sp.]
MSTKSIIAVILILMVVVFTIQNTEVVTIKFLTFELTMSRVLVILGCFFIGLASGLLLAYRKQLKQSK